MLTRYLLRFFLTLWTLGALLAGRAAAQEPPPLPVCQPWAGTAWIYPSPMVARDHTLFSRGGYPQGYGLTYSVLKSADRGLTWQQFSPERGTVVLSPSYGTDRTLAIEPWPPDKAYFTTDGGASWRAIIFPRTWATVFALGDAQHLFLGYGQEIGMPQPMELQASSDGGQSWQVRYEGLEVRDVVVSPAFAQDRTLLITLGLYHYNGGILKSTDAGFTWQRADAGIYFPGGDSIQSLRFSPTYTADRTLFCADEAGAMGSTAYKSTDAGANWQLMADPIKQPELPPELLISPRYQQDQTLWAVWNQYMHRVSRDGGRTWHALPYSIKPQAAAEYCRSTGECGVELYGLTHEGPDQTISRMYRSYDYGQTWQCLEDPTRPWDPTPTPPPAPAEIPEPATWLLLGSGLAALGGCVRRRRQ